MTEKLKPLKHRHFVKRWFMSTNHKDIGILYLIVSVAITLILLGWAVYIRLQVMDPGVQYMCLENAKVTGVSADTCGLPPNYFIAFIGVLILFLAVIPALVGGFGNYFMTSAIGAPDMAFPRINKLSFWIYFTGGVLGMASLFTASSNIQSVFDVGWGLAIYLSITAAILGWVNVTLTFLKRNKQIM